jgi:hypothetical protein
VKLYMLAEDWVMAKTKYFFYVLVIYLYPTSFQRFFFNFGRFPWNDIGCFIQMSISAFFAFMAFLSYKMATPENNPGYVEWEHFRTQEQLNDVADK